jgi:[acyl-carrier-protein] S-malonyltransferase
MKMAEEELATAIANTTFKTPICPVYQNVDAKPYTDAATIQRNLIAQLTAPVRWTQSVVQMTTDGATLFVECGPGKVLQGLVKKISPQVNVASA